MVKEEEETNRQVDQKVLNVGIHEIVLVFVILQGRGNVVEVLVLQPASRLPLTPHKLHEHVVAGNALHANALFLGLLHLVALNIANGVQDLRIVVLLRALLRHGDAVTVQ